MGRGVTFEAMTEYTPTPERLLRTLDVDAHLADPALKQAFVTPMFDIIAPRYDRFTRWFSFGMDAQWKREAIDAVRESARRLRPVQRALDLATGTGDLAVALARLWPGVRVQALDASPRMIEQAARRLSTRDADLADVVAPMVGDMMALPQADASVDVVTASYAVRNVPDARVAVREMARVLRPGGVLVTLDFYRPAFAPWRVAFLTYLQLAGDMVGYLWHRDPVVYGYIARSIQQFMSDDAFSALLCEEGFEVISVRRYLFGGVARHTARRSSV
ncbi:bifunctional demethylmenaquinone methyltransferase/2-methoxy-6-polyprenyl-1,4-benzoquinol methylase UbiE [Gemmatimonas sp.]